jgi:small subunit ribosomal protein S6
LKTYEGMFVVDSKECKKNSGTVEDQVQALIAKCGGEVKEFLKWDERKLAYEIKGNTVGTYYLSYFTGDSETIHKLNRECQLSPVVLRALFLNITEIPEIEPERTRGYYEEDEFGKEATVNAAKPVEKAIGLIDEMPDTEMSSSDTETPEPPGEEESAPAESDEKPVSDVADEEEDRDRESR